MGGRERGEGRRGGGREGRRERSIHIAVAQKIKNTQVIFPKCVLFTIAFSNVSYGFVQFKSKY